jgi:hypothetical protein
MNLASILNPSPPKLRCHIPEIDKHLNLDHNRLVGICSQDDMLTTAFLHYVAGQTAMNGDHVLYVSASGELSKNLYGLTEEMSARISACLTNDPENLAKMANELENFDLIIYEALGSSYYETDPDKSISRTLLALKNIHDIWSGTILFAEYPDYGGEPQSKKYMGVSARIHFRVDDLKPPYENFTFMVEKCGTKSSPSVFSGSHSIFIPKRPVGYSRHQFFFHTYSK